MLRLVEVENENERIFEAKKTTVYSVFQHIYNSM